MAYYEYEVVSESYRKVTLNPILEKMGCIVVKRCFNGKDGVVEVYMIAAPSSDEENEG